MKQTKIVLALLIEMGNVGDAMGRTKGAARFMSVTNLFDELMALSNFSVDELKAELKGMKAEQRAELLAFLQEKLDIADDKLETLIEQSLVVVEKAVTLYFDAKAIFVAYKKVE